VISKEGSKIIPELEKMQHRPHRQAVFLSRTSITDFNGFLGLAYISGTVRRTNTVTGEVLPLPFLNSDMRFMKGVFRGTDGQIHQGAFAFV
jgi:hypothetical protein